MDLPQAASFRLPRVMVAPVGAAVSRSRIRGAFSRAVNRPPRIGVNGRGSEFVTIVWGDSTLSKTRPPNVSGLKDNRTVRPTD